MAKIRTYGIVIKRKDMTIPPTKEEEKIGKEKNIENFRIPRSFTVRVNRSIPPTHNLCENGVILF